MPKFSIGQEVVNTVSKRGIYEPSVCTKYERMIIDKVEVFGETYQYTCGYDGYQFLENELISVEDFRQHNPTL